MSKCKVLRRDNRFSTGSALGSTWQHHIGCTTEKSCIRRTVERRGPAQSNDAPIAVKNPYQQLRFCLASWDGCVRHDSGSDFLAGLYSLVPDRWPGSIETLLQEKKAGKLKTSRPPGELKQALFRRRVLESKVDVAQSAWHDLPRRV
jgi:hypothetical protein